MKNPNLLWLIFALLVLLIVFVPAAYGQNSTIAMCDEQGNCIIRVEMLERLIHALEYWHGQAKTCKGV